MRKRIIRLLVLTLIVIAMTYGRATKVYAAAPSAPAKVTYYAPIDGSWMFQVKGITTSKAIKNLKSSNMDVVRVYKSTYNGKAYIEVAWTPLADSEAEPMFGTSTVTYDVKANGKTYHKKTIVTIKKYQNPFSLYKIGTKKYTGYFDEGQDTFVKSKKVKGKLKIKVKKGWKIKKIYK